MKFLDVLLMAADAKSDACGTEEGTTKATEELQSMK